MAGFVQRCCKSLLPWALCALAGATALQSLTGAEAKMALVGVNEAGLEFTPGTVPGTVGQTFFPPTADSINFYTSNGATAIRLPFLWERLQTSAGATLDATYLALIDTAVQQITASGTASVILDCHNYAKYQNQDITTNAADGDSFVSLWTQLASKYKGNNNVIFGLMNEPNNVQTTAWFALAQRAMTAIRQAGASNLILVCGNAWSGAHSWQETWYGTSNAQAAPSLSDTNFAFEMHQYFDSDGSGQSDSCDASAAAGYLQKVSATTAWLKQNKYRAFLGEFAVGPSSGCIAILNQFLAMLEANSDVWMGWSYFAAGSGWGSSWYSVEPTGGAVNKPQWAVLAAHMSGAGSVAPSPSAPIVPPSGILTEPILGPNPTGPTSVPTVSTPVAVSTTSTTPLAILTATQPIVAPTPGQPSFPAIPAGTTGGSQTLPTAGVISPIYDCEDEYQSADASLPDAETPDSSVPVATGVGADTSSQPTAVDDCNEDDQGAGAALPGNSGPNASAAAADTAVQSNVAVVDDDCEDDSPTGAVAGDVAVPQATPVPQNPVSNPSAPVANAVDDCDEEQASQPDQSGAVPAPTAGSQPAATGNVGAYTQQAPSAAAVPVVQPLANAAAAAASPTPAYQSPLVTKPAPQCRWVCD